MTDDEVLIGGQVFKTNPIMLQVSREMLEDAASVRDLWAEAIDRRLNPWRYPDLNRWPEFVPLPALERARIALSVARTRVRGAWVVLRGGEPLSDEGGEW